jgi:hypothetical protein
VSLKGVLFALLAVTSGCSVLGSHGPSEVARGEYYSAGKPEYDSFFIVLHEKQVELLAAPNEPADVRSNLTRAVALTPDASDDSLRERLGQELKKLAGLGLRLRLEVPEPSRTLDASATLYSSETSTSTPLRTSLPEQATRLVRSRNQMLANKDELDKLRVMGITLEGSVDQVFRTDGPWKRSEVHKNLDDGQKVITLMQARAQDVVDTDSKLLALLATVATSDQSLGKTANAAPPPPEDAKPALKRNAPRPTPAGTSPKPVVTPTAKPTAKRSEDDAPAPKPTQGSAPAEIEP